MRSFGPTGLKVSVLGFGALQIGDPTLDEPHVARVLNHVLDTGLPDWTHATVVAGIDAARDRLRTDVIDIVHLHSCGQDVLRAGGAPVDAVQAGYRARFAAVRSALQPEIADWDAFALRFTAFADGVDSVIVGGASTANVDRNLAAVSLGPLAAEEQQAVHAVYAAHAREWGGLV